MVRIKNRWLLVNILYPHAKPTSATANRPSDKLSPLPSHVDFHHPSPDKLHAGILVRVIKDGVAELFGDWGVGMVGSSIAVRYWSPATSTAIIRVSRDYYRLVWAALSFVTELPMGTPCVMRVVKVSGTIRKCEEEAIRRAKSDVLRAQRQAEEGKGENAGGLKSTVARAEVDVQDEEGVDDIGDVEDIEDEDEDEDDNLGNLDEG